MTVTDDELDASLRAWGAAYRATGTAPAEPVRIAGVFEVRRRPLWPMLAAALLVLAVAVSVVAYRASRPTSVAGGTRCPGQFSVHDVNEEQTLPVGLGVVLRYRGAPCKIPLRAPAVELVGADGHRYGTGAGGDRPVGSAVIQPDGTVSFAIDNFLACREIPRQKYSLDVFLGGGHVSVPIGVRTGVPNLCLAPRRTIGSVSRLAVSPPETGSVTGRLVVVGGPVVSTPPQGIPGRITVTGAVTRTVQTTADGRFSVILPTGTYRLVGRSSRFTRNGVPQPCAARNVTVVANQTVRASVVCPAK